MYRVFIRSRPYGGSIRSFVVSDQPENLDKNRNMDYPAVVEFAVSMRYNEDEQQQRAREYCEYLNKHLSIIPPIGE